MSPCAELTHGNDGRQRLACRIPRWIAAFLVAAGLAACGGGGGDDVSEEASWVRIDAPLDGETIHASSVLVKGNASTSSPDAPSTVYWDSSAGGSGTLPSSVSCFGVWPFGSDCLIAFEGTVPLAVGTNTITVRLAEGASDSVTVERPLLASISGKVLTDTGAYVPAVTVTLSGGVALSARVDGEYRFDWLSVGDYTITPSLPPPQSASCLAFSPPSRSVRIDTGDVTGVDFVAAPAEPCYKVTALLTGGDPVPVVMVLQDSAGNAYRATTSPSSADFWHIAPGTYTLTAEPPSFVTVQPSSAVVTVTGADETVYFQLVQ